MSLAATKGGDRDGGDAGAHDLQEFGRPGRSVATAGDDLSEDDRRQLRQQLASWRDQLLDGSRANPLIHLDERTGALLLAGPSSEAFLEHLARDGWDLAAPLARPQSDDPHAVIDLRGTDELVAAGVDAAALTAVLDALAERAAIELSERGAAVLHVGCGALTWSSPTGDRRTSPLLLVPVALEPIDGTARLVATGASPVPNPALGPVLADAFGLGLDDRADGDDPEQVRAAAERWAAAVPAAAATVDDRLVLAAVPVDLALARRELVDHDEALLHHDLVQALATGPRPDLDPGFDPVPDGRLDEDAPPEELHAVLDADADQVQCAVAARDGRSFVIEGPSGAGRSRTVVDVIAELLAQGCRVLHLSERAGELDAVERLLDEAQLGPFTLRIPPVGSTADQAAEVRQRAAAPPVRQPPRLPEGTLAELRRRRRQLSDHAAAMVEPRALGRSLHAVVGHLARLAAAGVPDAPRPASAYATLTADALEATLAVARDAAGLPEPGTDADSGWRSPWRALRDTTTDPDVLRDLVEGARGSLVDLLARADTAADAAGLARPATLADVEWLHRVVAHLAAAPAVPTPAGWLAGEDLDAVRRRAAARRRRRAERAERIGHLTAITPAWAGVDPAVGPAVRQALGALAELRPPFVVSPERTVASLASAVDASTRGARRLEALALEAAELAQRLGLAGDAAALTLGRCSLLADLGRSVAAAPPPPAAWFEPTAARAVRAAIAALGDVVERWRTADAEVRSAFGDGLERLDVEAFWGSPEDVEPALSRWSPTGRDHRTRLVAAALSGDVGDRELAALAAARRRQALGRELAAAEVAGGPAEQLGPAWAGPATDFGRVQAALAVVDDTFHLVGTAPPAALVDRLAHGTTDRADARQRARTLQAHLLQLVDEIGRDLPEAPELVTAPLSVLGGWLTAVADGLRPLVDLLEPVAQTTGVTSLASLADLARRRSELAALPGPEADASDDAVLGAWARTDAGRDPRDPGGIEAALDWAGRLRDLVGGPVDRATATRLLVAPTDAGPLGEATTRTAESVDAVLDLFEPSAAVAMRSSVSGHLDGLRALLDELADTVGDPVATGRRARRGPDPRAVEIGAVLAWCRDHDVVAGTVPLVVERAVLSAWVSAVTASDDRLVGGTGDQHDALVAAFRALDRRLVADSRARVIEACDERRSASGVGEGGPIGAIPDRADAGPRTLRDLFDDLGDEVLDVVPCLLASPATASRVLPSDLELDVVIVDAASSLRTADAIGAISRARQLVVVGDADEHPAPRATAAGPDVVAHDLDADVTTDTGSLLAQAVAVAGLPVLSVRPRPEEPVHAVGPDLDDDRPGLLADVAAVLRDRGHEVVAAGPDGAIAVRDPDHPERPALVVEDDGPRYHAAAAARDRDRLLPEAWEAQGVRLHRIWGLAWHADRDGEIARLGEAVDTALRDGPLVAPARPADGPAVDRPADPAPRWTGPGLDVIDPDGIPEWAEAYEVATLVIDRRAAIDAPGTRSVLGRMITEVVRVEGPISDRLLVQRLCDAWGVPASAKATAAVEHLLAQAIRRADLIRPEVGFVATRRTDVVVRVPDPDDERTIREAGDVPAAEVDEVVLNLLEGAPAANEDELVTRVARVYGWRRLGPDVLEAVELAVDRLVQRGQVVRTGPGEVALA